MDIEVYFAGGKKVYADFRGFTIKTDQPKKRGGEESAPSPFDLFLVSIGTCAGYFVQEFCEKRGIPHKDIRIVQRSEKDEKTKVIKKFILQIELPEDFPEKYQRAVIKAAETCIVKKSIAAGPEFEVTAQKL